MGITGFLGRLFGGGDSGNGREGEPEEYQGYTITPAPRPQNGQFLTAGSIRKNFPEGVKEQGFIRADTHQSFDAACAHALAKGRQIIDEQGERLFDGR